MFIDARNVTANAVIEADLCIVGGGAAGITIAQEFIGSGVDVCVLESGGLDLDWGIQSLYRGTNVGLRYFDLDVCQIRYFGGNTNAWGGWCRPLDEIDFRQRPWVRGSGWPITRAALRPYYRQAHALCEISSDDYDPARAAAEIADPRAALAPFDPEKLETSIYRFSAPKRFGMAYRDALRRSTNLRCYLNANVLRINTTDTGREVTRLMVGCLSGNRFEVRARYFILAAGGIENARLLLLSTDAVTAGLGNENDLVGRHFMEHPHTKRVLLATRRPLPTALYGLTFRDRAISARLALPVALQEREELLNYSGNIHPIYIGHETEGWLAFRKFVLSISGSRRTDPYVRFPPYGRKGLSARQLYAIARQFDKVTIAAFLQLFRPNRFIAGYVLESKSEQAPNPASRVLLDHECDAFGLNRVKLDWRMLPIDRHTVIRGEAIIEEELRRLGIGRLEPLDATEIDGWPTNLEGGWHQIGTTRMDDDPRNGVVDANGKMHSVANLFVAGSSVFPTGGAAPPTLTIVAMALRLADHLKKLLAARRPVAVAPAPAPAPEVSPLLVSRSRA